MKVFAYFILAIVLFSCNDFEEFDAEMYYDEAKALYRAKNYDNALNKLELVFNNFDELDTELQSKSLYLRGFIYYLQDKNKLAYQDYMNAIELAEELGDAHRVSKLNNEMGQIFYEQELYEQSLSYFQLALNMSDQATMQDEAYYNYGVGKTLGKLGRLEEGMDYLLRAARINLQLKNHDALAKAYITMGQQQRAAGNRDIAVKYYKDVIELASLTSNPSKYRWMANNDAGLAYLVDNELDKAEEFLRRSLEYRSNDSQLWITYNNLGRLYNKRENYKQAWQYFKQSLKYNSKNLELNELAITSNALRKTFEELNQPDSLLHYTMLINDLTLPAMQTKSWLKDEERKIALLTKYQDYQREKVEKDQYAKTSWLMAFIMTFIFVSGVLSMRLWKIYNYKSTEKGHALIKNSNEMVYLLDMFKNEKEEMKKVMDQKLRA